LLLKKHISDSCDASALAQASVQHRGGAAACANYNFEHKENINNNNKIINYCYYILTFVYLLGCAVVVIVE
jgi:hypothetical protein